MSTGLKSLKMNTLTGRLVASAALWTVLVLAIGGVILSIAFKNYVEDDFDTRLIQQMDDILGLVEVNINDELQLRRNLSDHRFEDPYSGHYWQISEKGSVILKSRSLWDTEIAIEISKPQTALVLYDQMSQELETIRIAERDIILPEADDRIFRVQLAQHTVEIEEAVESFDTIILRSLGLIALAILVAVIAQIRFALSPIRKVRTALKDVRRGRTANLDDEVPDDIKPLVIEINTLIHHNSSLINRARTHVGNLAHALKTPLSVLSNEAQAMEDAELADKLSKQTEAMQSHINHHLKRARIAGGGATGGVTILPSIMALKSAMERLHSTKNLSISITGPDDLIFAGEKEDLDEMLGNIMDNAAKWCRSEIAVKVTSFPEAAVRPMAEIAIEDDGDGVDESQFDKLFERGHRLDEQTPGTGLGLHIVREIAELSGGSVRLNRADLGGLRVTIALPIKE